ncbi:MAG: M48 family metallopeptidase [Nitrospirota bacterium]|nr:MAG: M48 family metallopeptidase [Nitrospirota bacterium]
MRDFFERQEEARQKTFRLIGLFILSVILIIVSVHIAISGLYYLALLYKFEESIKFSLWDAERFLGIAVITLSIILTGSLCKTRELKDGGPAIARLLGGRQVERNTKDLDEIKLLNVIEEMAIASGIPVPDAFVMDREGGINAFAAGFDIDDAVVCVTKGALSLLNRDELQGVVAHEFSHIFNRDTVINIRLMGWLHGILVIGLIGEGLLRVLRHTRGRALYLGLAGGVLYILGYIGLFFGKLIKSAISRQREFLADAAAVQYTRNPSGLSGALQKIGGLSFGSRLIHPKVSEASHMYFSDGVGGSFSSLMATHPPLFDRIKILDPRFDGSYPQVEALKLSKPEYFKPYKPRPHFDRSRIISGAAALAILESIGTPMKEHEELARSLLSNIPDAIRIATREIEGAIALIYVLLLDNDPDIRNKQLSLLKDHEDSKIYAETDTISAYLKELDPHLRLPLADLSIPTLKQLSTGQYTKLKDNIIKLVTADEKMTLFEYVLSSVLMHNLDAHILKQKRKPHLIYSVKGVARECSIVLSLLAHVGHHDNDTTLKAFQHGSRILAEPYLRMDLLDVADCTFKALNASLEKLATTSPLIKKKVMAACLECLVFDGSINVEEAELFRAIGEMLGCPVPPWLIFQSQGSI